MIFPIVAYGDPILKQVAQDIPKDFPELPKLIEAMYNTMYKAHGVGLAAPQIGKSIRIFIVDASPFAEEEESLKTFKRTFINPHKVEERGEIWSFNEGCLSIPEVREDVKRPEEITLRYHNEQFEEITETFSGIAARVVQHELDHLDGVLFTDLLSPLKRKLIKGKLKKITQGKIQPEYRMKFPKK